MTFKVKSRQWRR